MVILLIFISSAAFAAKQEWKYRDYKITRENVDDIQEKIRITKNDQTVFEVIDI